MSLEMKDITLCYEKKEIVKDINIKFEEGAITAIIGPNGSGKSTIIKALGRCLKPAHGKILLDGQDINKINTKKLAKNLSILPQIKNLPEEITVEELVSFGRYPHLKFGDKLTDKDKDIIDWALRKTGIENFRHKSLNNLSGGEIQRVWIAMCIAQQPKIILLDEPTTFLDICHQIEMMELIKDLNEKLHLTVIMVIHDINQAIKYSHNILVLEKGSIFKYGKSSSVICEDTLKKVFKVEGNIVKSDNEKMYFIPEKTIN